MRVLVLADEPPWPVRTGYRIRLSEVVRTLAAVHEVDLLVASAGSDAPRGPVPADVPLARCAVVEAAGRPAGRGRRVTRWAASDLPRELLARDWTAARDVLAGWLRTTSYDVVWFSHAATYAALADLVTVAAVVDLDNLDAAVVRGRRRLRASRLRAGVEWVDERRWQRLQARVTGGAAVTVVCSELDRLRVGAAGVVEVVANGYELPDQAAPPAARDGSGGSGGSEGPLLLMVGLLTYGPNLDGARFFAGSVLPLLRTQVPGARFRVVGRGADTPAAGDLHALPGVVLAGEVVDVGPELAAADVVVVPVRYGGGTRIKILEAFAHGVPVVTTTAGCEGLDVVDGVHLLVADDPAELAAACARLLGDEALRRTLVAQAGALWSHSYRWQTIRPSITGALARAVR